MNRLAISQDRDAVGYMAQFVEAMRDVDDPHATPAQAAHDAEHLGGFGFRERRGRFVENQQARRAVESAAYFDKLFLGRD